MPTDFTVRFSDRDSQLLAELVSRTKRPAAEVIVVAVRQLALQERHPLRKTLAVEVQPEPVA